jgi:hypothetical protein
MVKQQVYSVRFAIYFNGILPAHKSATGTQLHQKVMTLADKASSIVLL